MLLDDEREGRLTGGPAVAMDEKEHYTALPTHYLFGAIPVSGNA